MQEIKIHISKLLLKVKNILDYMLINHLKNIPKILYLLCGIANHAIF